MSLSVGAAVLGAVISVSAFAGTASAHAAGSAHPDDWDRLLWIVLIMAIIVAIVVYSLIGLALWRYRESSPFVRKEPSIHNPRLEAIWTIIPVILVTVIVILSLQVLQTTEDLPEEGIEIEVIGRQFEWLFVYPDNTTSVNDVWVEEGQTVIFKIWATDVIHSFWLPDFRLKVDAFPNYVDDAYIIAEPAGDYEIVCAEFCGDIHSEMLGTLHIFKKGLSDKPWGPPPGEVPPPPEILEVTIDIELREDGGPGATSPWSMRPSLIELPQDSEVTFRIWNNGTEAHGFHLAAPYDRTITEISPGGFAYMNFTADMPTRGIVASCPDDDHRAMGMRATVLVEAEAQEPDPVEEGSGFPHVGVLYGMGLLLLGVVLAAALKEPRGARHEDHELEVEDRHDEFQVSEGEEGEKVDEDGGGEP
jgi:cytochrome c oxidase subunit II